MKKQFYETDLKEEYLFAFEYYKALYLQKNPASSEKLAFQYATKMVRKQARKLYEYRKIMEAIDSDATLDEILSMHKSCAERGEFYNYYECLEEILKDARYVLDIGCGLNPCMVLLEYDNIIQYFGYDNDTHILEILQLLNRLYLNQKLTLLSKSDWNDELQIMNINPDVVLVQKLVSNLYYNRNTKMTDKIAQIDAKYYFVSGCQLSLSRNISIKEEENSAIEWFIHRYSFKKIKYVETSSEFGWILTK